MTLPPFAASEGPRNAPRIAIVGEAWGEQEALLQAPFQGYSGQELTRMLAEAGIDRKECFLTNVFALRPGEDNKVSRLFTKKAEAGRGATLPPAGTGEYVREEFLGELDRLREELSQVQPNLIIALGNTAVWALVGTAKISSVRGSFAFGTLIPGSKVLPTYHPAAVLRRWEWRTIAVQDFIKAKANAHTRDILRPERYVLIEPTLGEIMEWFTRPASLYSVDVETTQGQIDCIGFSRDIADGIVIPFLDKRKPDWNYWPDPADETRAWRLVGAALASPVRKVFQNGLYDLQYIYGKMKFKVVNCSEDTMILHHSIYPELQKGLGFLGSIYTNEASWKLMRKRAEESTKRDE